MMFVFDSKHKLLMFSVACKEDIFRWMMHLFRWGGGVGGRLMTVVVDNKHELLMFGVVCKEDVFRWMMHLFRWEGGWGG